MNFMRILAITVLIGSFLVLNVKSSDASQDTPKSVLKHKFYKSLTALSNEKKYPFIIQNIHTRLNGAFSSKKDLNAAMFWMRDEYLYNNGDPKYGLSYVQFLEMLSQSMKQANPEQANTLKLNSVIHFFVAEHFLLSDLAYCQDHTAGQNSLAQISKVRPKYTNAFSSFKPEDKEMVYKSIFDLIEERKARLPYTDICKSGALHMKKALDSGQYKEQGVNRQDGTKYIDDTMKPDLISDQEWLPKRTKLIDHLQNELLALQ